jgi:hypothetical protein
MKSILHMLLATSAPILAMAAPLHQALFMDWGAAAPPRFVNAGTFTSGVLNNQVPPLPASIVPGNLLLSYCNNTGTGTGAALTVSTGWTIVNSNSSKANARAWAWRVATGSDVAPTWSTTETVVTIISQVLQYSGTHPTTPIDVSSAAGSTIVGTALLGTTITTGFNNELIVAILGVISSNQTIPTPTGYTLEGSTNNSVNGSSTVCDKVQPTAGATGGFSVTITAAQWMSFQIGIRTP